MTGQSADAGAVPVMGEATNVIAPPSSSVYYRGGYWNDFPAVAAEINRRVSGSSDVSYLEYFRRLTGNRRFTRALFINCGNGWVEREFMRLRMIESAVGVDISADLLAQARELAGELPFRYVQMDVNGGVFPDERYDLIVNFAAGHHVAYVDRVYRALSRVLTEDGLFLNYDYIGPHRNQYPYEQWSAVWELNQALPADARADLRYPHMPTILLTDPSEAVHSELTMETFRRYFHVHEFRPAGGAVAYPLLTFNAHVAALPEDRRNALITRILEADHQYLVRHPDETLFAFWYGSARKTIHADAAMLARWEREELEREERAAARGGLYYRPTLLQALMYPEYFGGLTD